jgi:hypothetical protein
VVLFATHRQLINLSEITNSKELFQLAPQSFTFTQTCNMKKLSSLLGTILFIATLHAQVDLTGRYKLVEGKFETVTGKYVHFLPEEYAKEPCLANVIYTFAGDGKIITTADNCPDSTKKKLFGPELVVKWERTGNNKMIISTKDDYIDPMTFDLHVYITDTRRKVMVWSTILEVDPNDPNPEKAKKLIMVYSSF